MASARAAPLKKSATRAVPAAFAAAPPRPTAARHMMSWVKFRTSPPRLVKMLQSATPKAVIPVRECRSESTPTGSAAMEKTSTYAAPSHPRCESVRWRSRLIGSKSAKMTLRSM